MKLPTGSSCRKNYFMGKLDRATCHNSCKLDASDVIQPLVNTVSHDDDSSMSSIDEFEKYPISERLSSTIGELLSDCGKENHDYNDDWRKIPVNFWAKNDARNWLLDTSRCLDSYYKQIQNYVRKSLKDNTHSLSLRDFILYDSKNGRKIYDLLYKHDPGNGDPLQALERLCTSCDTDDATSPSSCSENSGSYRFGTQTDEAANRLFSFFSHEESENCTSEGTERSQGRRGRPPGTDIKPKYIPESQDIWKYIIKWLHSSEYNPVYIRWENYEEGEFRFVKPKEIAKLWGARKSRNGHNSMTYENFTRTMRYHYHTSGRLAPVYGKKHVYKFGGNAIGWKTDRPILPKPISRS